MINYKIGNAIIANYLGYFYYSKSDDPLEYGWRLDKKFKFKRDYFLSRSPYLTLHTNKKLLTSILIDILLQYNISFNFNNGIFSFEVENIKFSFSLDNIYFNLISLIQLLKNEQKRFQYFSRYKNKIY